MRRKLTGVREIIKGQRYEVNYVVGGRRFQYRINAASLSEAHDKKLEDMAEKRKNASLLLGSEEHFNAGFSDAWEKLHADLIADNLPKKTIGHYANTYNRLFNNFVSLKFPQIASFNQLNLPFFKEYKNYYVNELERPNGWRGELIFVKAIIQRLYGLGFCDKDIIEKLKEMKKPRPNKKQYPNISNSQIRKLLDFIRRDRRDYYFLIYFMVRTGRRISETTLIEKKDVEWTGLKPVKINIRAEITKMRQYAPLTKLDSEFEQVVREANRRSLRHKTPYLFCNRRGRRCAPDRVRLYLKMASRRITGIEITPHYFRHRFLTECGKINVPIVDVMAISGIKDINVIVKYYSHSTDEGLTKVLESSRV
jgi:integrase